MMGTEETGTGAQWRAIRYGPWKDTVIVPRARPDEATRADMDLPATLLPVPDDGVVQRPVFDPAATHHAFGMRLGEPSFAEPSVGARWYAARRHALHHVLTALARSPWAGHLVLRGSMLLKSWFGDAAREPGDLDFVVVPETWQLTDDRTEQMLDGIAAAAGALSHRGGPVRLDAQAAVRDEIWSYDRVPGRRLVIPWTAEADGVPGGSVQLDFVFTERLPAPAEPAEISGPPGTAPVVIQAATRALSLAWKVLWLVSDAHPEAKDLYDAVLLAESTELPHALLREVFRGVDGGSFDRHPVLLESLYGFGGEWSELRKEYPDRGGIADPDPWVEHRHIRRLVTALARTFALEDGSGETAAYRQRAAWFASLTAECAEIRAERGIGAVQNLLMERWVAFENAVVITRELAGRDRCALRDAAAVVEGFRRDHPSLDRRPWLLADPDEAVRRLSEDGTES
ncbi:nucleotidyl transferase AbiEii/AbiGii toxin family protein [Streptomyces sp. RPA4-5]|uniref:nucleotidyl transferase AbiEii/AbiGii toxin family protein n=1 Tax=Streptomyces sp. RPA4-5 TaxID=2721245 RepID=UPI00143EA7D6|nr:nucleotidyl transferase AbiEii/AbiGii toxin family protein [Streptomyces sp. RPA4-5]QIY59192.1 nucleotidyl transferase AbiEii/AbiGii toxin family protein [Streptomyces sp. RPA4-5]